MQCLPKYHQASFGSCSNYALKKTAPYNTDQYEQEAAELVRSNFYVDDLLRFVDDPKTEMILVKNVVETCTKSGFDLKKFIFSNRELLMSIPENQRRNGVTNAK